MWDAVTLARPTAIESSDIAPGSSTTAALAVGASVQGTVGSLGDHDWYRISLTAGQQYSFAAIGTGVNGLRDPYLYLRDALGNLLASDDDSGPAAASSITFTATLSGTYYLDVGAWNEASTGQYGLSATLGARPSYDVLMGAGAVESYAAWTAPGTPATITYGFRASAPGYTASGSNISTFSQVSAAEMASVQAILALWSAVCNVTFVPVNPGGYTDSATLLIGNYTDGSDGAGAFAYYPGSTSSSSPAGDLWLNLAGGISTASQIPGTYSWFAIMHELGHALGLSHPGDYNAGPGVSITYGKFAQFIQDSEQYSVMSYFGGSNTGESPGNFATADTPLLFDIYELQQKYGANLSTRSGATIYGTGSTAGPIYDFASNATPQFCIWDGGGTDTLDCSAYGQNQRIDLNEGAFSDVGGSVDNISIALGVTIENAVGGSGQDTITGNAADNTINGGAGNDDLHGVAGNDVLDPGAGADRLEGGAGNDVFMFKSGPSGAGDKSITDFTLGQDKLDARAFGYASLSDLLAAGGSVQQVAGGTLVTFASAGPTARLANVNAASLSNGDFLFADQAALSLVRLYDAAFDRDADAGGLAGWVNALNQGQSLNQIAQAFVGSAEFATSYGPHLTDSDFIETLYWNALDRPAEPAGREAALSALAQGMTRATFLAAISESPEHLEVGDVHQSAADTSHRQELMRLYDAAFDRDAEAGGLVGWMGAMDQGWSLNQVAQAAVVSAEFSKTYGSLSDSDFVEALYWNALDRPAEAAGKAAALNALAHGMTRATFLAAISESPEHLEVGNVHQLTQFMASSLAPAGNGLAAGSLTSDGSPAASLDPLLTQPHV